MPGQRGIISGLNILISICSEVWGSRDKEFNGASKSPVCNSQIHHFGTIDDIGQSRSPGTSRPEFTSQLYYLLAMKSQMVCGSLSSSVKQV